MAKRRGAFGKSVQDVQGKETQASEDLRRIFESGVPFSNLLGSSSSESSLSSESSFSESSSSSSSSDSGSSSSSSSSTSDNDESSSSSSSSSSAGCNKQLPQVAVPEPVAPKCSTCGCSCGGSGDTCRAKGAAEIPLPSFSGLNLPICSLPSGKYVSKATGGSSTLVDGPNGPGTLPSNPWMAEPEPNVAAVVFDDCTSYWFDESGNSYTLRDTSLSNVASLRFDDDQCRFIFTRCGDGSRYEFDERGTFVRKTGGARQPCDVTTGPDGKPIQVSYSVDVGGSPVTTYLDYGYVPSGENAGLLESVTLSRVASPPTLLRRMVYTYYETGDDYGSPGDLKTAVEQYLSGVVWVDKNVTYYRWYESGEPNGFVHGLKYKVGPEAFERLAADPLVSDPFMASNAKVAEYADNYFEYDAQQRVTKSVVRAGLLTYTFVYAESAFSDGHDHWKRKTTMTRPDGSQVVTYSNYLQQILLEETIDGSDSWIEYWRFDANGQQVLHAHPSAVESYDEGVADLDVSLRSAAGLIEWTTYYSSTTATDTTPGGVEGQVQATGVQQGESGTPITTSSLQYFVREADGQEIYPIADSTVYREDNGTGAITTSYAYTWYPDTLQVQQRTTTLPVVSALQNGTGETETTVEIYDEEGYLQWTRDARGYIGYREHDWVTGAIVQEIQDVDDTQMTVPAGWETPPGGGLHLVTDYEHDAFGRITQALGPVHAVGVQNVRTASWTVYKDLDDETWSGQGYAVGMPGDYDYTLMNPVSLQKMSADGLTRDSIQAVRGGKEVETCDCAAREAGIVESAGRLAAGDAFPQSSWVRWSRTISDVHDLTIASRVYHAIPDAGEGVVGTNYDQTTYGYDAMARQNRVVSASGTVSRTVYDVRGLTLSNWVGTNDSGATDSDPTGGGATGNDMVAVTELEYDGGTDGGDGNLTKLTAFVDDSISRETLYDYDFRNRRTVVDGEIDFWQQTVYDNLDRAIRVDRRDTTSGGNLIARSETLFDDRGRTYRTIRYAVDPSTGTVGNSLVDNSYFDANGNLIESRPAGSEAVMRAVFDGAGRQIETYVGYVEPSSSSSSSDGSPAADLIVFEQSETVYDDAGNVIFMTSRQRFHDATGAGLLQGPSGSQPKSRDSFQATWQDGIGRQIAAANYGTNDNAGAPTRPATPPASSDAILVSRTVYNDRGEAFESILPDDRVDRVYADDASRSILSIVNFVPSGENCYVPGSAENVVVERTYLAGGRLSQLIVKNRATGDQITQYLYGSDLDDSEIASNDLLVAEIYPDSAGSSDRVTYTYDRQSARASMTDQNGSTHEYVYDALGRPIADAVSTLGSGVDGAVRRIGRTYEVRGMVAKITSYSDAAGTTVANEVQNVYDDFGQLATQYQQHDGAVNVSTSPKVQYAYADGSTNTTRMTSMTYPDSSVLDYLYDDEAAGKLSRVRTLRFDSMDVCRYSYLGLGAIVRTDHLEPGLRLDYATGSGANPYAGLDRFGRVVDHLWQNYAAPADVVRIKYGYDRASNRLFREDVVAETFSKHLDELYQYDGQERLIKVDRGNLVDNGARIVNAEYQLRWGLDAVGNWSNFTLGTAASPASTVDQSRISNAANEITAFTAAVGGIPTPPAYDANGNMTSNNSASPVQRITWDAWNRIVKFEIPDGSGGWRTRQANAYDGQTWRIVKLTYSASTGALAETRRYLYSADWRAIQEDRVSAGVLKPERQYVYGLRYIDDVVLRDRDTTPSNPDPTFDERLYPLQDANWNVVALCDEDAVVQRRYAYTAYGSVSTLSASFESSTSFGEWTRFFASYEIEGAVTLYIVRNRYYSVPLGIWLSRDPIGYQDGMSLYAAYFVPNGTDPFGLDGWVWPWDAQANWVWPWDPRANWNPVATAGMYVSGLERLAAQLGGLFCKVANIFDDPNVLGDETANEVVTCACMYVGFADMFPPTSYLPVEAADCACNVFTSAQLLCAGRGGAFALYSLLTAADCLSLPLGKAVGGALGLSVGGEAGGAAGAGGGTLVAPGPGTAAGGLGGLTVGAASGAAIGIAVGDTLVDIAAFGMQNAIVEGSPLPTAQWRACCNVGRKLANPAAAKRAARRISNAVTRIAQARDEIRAALIAYGATNPSKLR